MQQITHAVNVHDTGQIKNISTLKTSAQYGWDNVYVYTASISPFRAEFIAVNSLLISMVLEGDIRGTLKIGNEESEIFLQPGFIVCMPPDISFEASIHSQAKVISIYISNNFLNDIAYEFSMLTNELFSLVHNLKIADDFLENFIGSLNNALNSGEQFTSLEIQSVARAIVIRIITKYATYTSKSLSVESGLPYPVLQRIYTYIDTHIHERISVERLASMAGVGTAQFARLFKHSANVTLHQYVIQRRIEKAHNLLVNTNMQIIDIAYECGFSDQVHLTRLFGRIMGFSPAKFRKMRK